jgi:hypothetical protein
MKTLGRILLILTAFAIVMGLAYLIVNTSVSSSSMNGPEVISGERFAPPTGERSGMDSPDMREGRWIFGLTKNVGIVAVIVALIVVPKSFMRRKAIPLRVS